MKTATSDANTTPELHAAPPAAAPLNRLAWGAKIPVVETTVAFPAAYFGVAVTGAGVVAGYSYGTVTVTAAPATVFTLVTIEMVALVVSVTPGTLTYTTCV